MPSWQHPAEQAECELRRAKNALRLSQAIHDILRQASDEFDMLVQVCAALVEAGCHTAAWLSPGRPVLVRSAPRAEVDVAMLARWFEGWDTIAAELAGVAAPLDEGPLAVPGASRAARLVLPLRDADHFFGTIAVALGEGSDLDDGVAIEQAVSGVAFAVATMRARAGRARDETERQCSEAQFARVMASIKDAVWAMSARSGQWVYLNEAFERICGRPAGVRLPAQ
ncbi:hypothetical protein [Cupriavidus sp. D39]|uniref:hypothetical protein n=1 Tax=Cupriavidus sp. D39 TaxID=2997877 RepID=UPI002271E0F1|nr:hypothetical protein [Cupriavidus sp. D39]MCY0853539.1 hypothetical protein [Cupriavidus sp. D39]